MSEQIIAQASESTLNINPNISIAEQRDFINTVMLDISLSDDNLIAFNTDVAFYTNFLTMFTDFETAFDKIDDIVLQMTIKEAILSSSFAHDLKSCIDKQVSLLLQKNEAIESVSFIANRTLDGVNRVCDILDNIKDLTQDGKFLKVIPENKLDLIFGWLQRIVNGITATEKSQDIKNIDNILEFKKDGVNNA